MTVSPLLLTSIDGLRPDAISSGRTPTLCSLMSRGVWTLEARTVSPSVTLPCHMSMTHGVDVDRHGVTTNVYQPPARPVTSLFDHATSSGLRVGMVFNWGPLRDLAGPEGCAEVVIHADFSSKDDDTFVADAACQYLSRKPFDLLFVYLGHTDHAGHEFGWMEPQYFDAVNHADTCLGQVLGHYASLGLDPNVIVLADHGGHGRAHGTEMEEDMTIPWIAAGPDVPGHGQSSIGVRIFDTAATATALLNIPSPTAWEGRNILDLVKVG